MYNGVFSKVVFCGPVNKMKDSNETVHIVVKHDRGYFGYHCAAEAMKMYPGYQGMCNIYIQANQVYSASQGTLGLLN